MSGGTLAWGITAAVLLIVTGIMIGWPVGHWRGRKHGIEEAGWKQAEVHARRPAPVRPAPPAETPRAGPGKHRHPAGPRHAELPAAGYLPAEPGPWGGTITVPAPVQAPPWETRPPEPVLEPTAVLPPPDPCTDSQFTRRMALDMDAWIAEHIGATDSVLKEITGGAR
jgi:hypothetical protein